MGLPNSLTRFAIFGILVALNFLGIPEVCHCQISSRETWPTEPSPTAAAISSSSLLHPKMNFRKTIAHSHLVSNSQIFLLPQIHSPQTKLTVQAGDTVHLPCKVHNLGEHHVLWKHDTNILAGSNITKYNDSRIDMLPDFTLVISQIDESYNGEYECIVTSWPQLSVVHSISVLDPPTISLLTPTNIIISEGESVEIGCIPHGNPLPRISWSMRDGILPVELLKGQLNESHLSLTNVTRAFAGLYVCTADNGVGRPAIGAIYVRVLYSPIIEVPRRRVHAGVSYSVHLVGLVHSDPAPKVHWRKGEDLIENSDRIYMELHGKNEYRLVFDTVKTSDFGTYSIEATNTLGIDLKHVELIGVPNAPVLTSWEAVDMDGIEVTLHWAVECYSSVIDYQLYFKPTKTAPSGEDMDETDPGLIKLIIPADRLTNDALSFIHTKSFTLRGLNESIIYEAAVQARNRYGWSHLSSICYFGTFPNSSSTKTKEMEEALAKIKNRFRESGFLRVTEEPSHQSDPSSSSPTLLSPWLIVLFLACGNHVVLMASSLSTFYCPHDF